MRWSALILASLSLIACSPSNPGGNNGGQGEDLSGSSSSSSSSGGGGCDNGRELCGDTCVDTQQSGDHCGSCGHGCGNDQVCQGGNCVMPPDCRQTPCTGLTYCDLGSGHCKSGCIADNQCGSNERCDSGSHACVCTNATNRCGGTCVTSTVDHCGPSCTTCADDAHGGPVCSAGQCGLTCDSGYRSCGGACAACPSGAASTTCQGSQCVAAACQAGFEMCQGACAACPTGNGAATFQCQQSQCVVASCSAGYARCAAGCCAWSRQDLPVALDGATAVVDHAGALHVGGLLYTSLANGSRNTPTHLYRSGSSWTSESIRDVGVQGRVFLTVAPDGTLYAGYNPPQGDGYGPGFGYGKRESGAWVTDTYNSSSLSVGLWTWFNVVSAAQFDYVAADAWDYSLQQHNFTMSGVQTGYLEGWGGYVGGDERVTSTNDRYDYARLGSFRGAIASYQGAPAVLFNDLDGHPHLRLKALNTFLPLNPSSAAQGTAALLAQPDGSLLVAACVYREGIYAGTVPVMSQGTPDITWTLVESGACASDAMALVRTGSGAVGLFYGREGALQYAHPSGSGWTVETILAETTSDLAAAASETSFHIVSSQRVYEFNTSGGSSCVPQCAGRACGTDGCGGSCGDCTGGNTCTAEGQCNGGSSSSSGGSSSGGFTDMQLNCQANYINKGDGCDCGCGVFDPDCATPGAASCEYCYCSADQSCTTIVADTNSSCGP